MFIMKEWLVPVFEMWYPWRYVQMAYLAIHFSYGKFRFWFRNVCFVWFRFFSIEVLWYLYIISRGKLISAWTLRVPPYLGGRLCLFIMSVDAVWTSLRTGKCPNCTSVVLLFATKSSGLWRSCWRDHTVTQFWLSFHWLAKYLESLH